MGVTAENIEMAENNAELLCSYACLLLADSEQEITADNINTVVKAAGASVPAYYAAIFEKVAGLTDGGVTKLVSSAGKVGGGAAAGGAAPAAAAGGAAPAAAKPESSEEEEMPAAGGLFDEGDDY